MPTDGSGNYTPPSNSWNPAVAGTTISPTDWAALLADLAQGLTDRLDADGSKTSTADQPMGGYKHTNVGNASARNQYLTVDQNQDGETVFAAATGSATSYLLTLTPAITVYATGMTVNFAVPVTNTGAVTLNINSVGTTASTITRYGLTLQAGALTAGDLASVMYTGTGWNLMSPQKGPGTAYTPVLAFGGASVGITYTLQEGFYTVMGRWVLFSATIILSNKGSSTGDATLTLPLTSSATPSVGFSFPGNTIYSNIDLNVGGARYTPAIFILRNSSSMLLGEQGDNTATASITDADFGNTSAVYVSGMYFI